MITRDGAKMSKSKGNVVSPAVDRGALRRRYGSLLCAVHRAAGPGRRLADTGVEGVYRFLRRLHRFTTQVANADTAVIGGAADSERDLSLKRKVAWAIKKVTDDMAGKFSFNTAIAALMELTNDCSRALQDGIDRTTTTFALSTAASLLLPVAPHVASECYHQLTGEHVWKQPWPEPDESLLQLDTVELACHVNGKLRGRFKVPADASEDAVKEQALALAEVQQAIGDRTIERVVVVPGRLINVVAT